MSSNVSTGADAVVVDRTTEMATYDALPRRWRVLVDSLPIPQRMSKIEEYRRTLGDDEGYRRVVDAFRSRFPGWTPPADLACEPGRSRL
jgi:hypothetical protein